MPPKSSKRTTRKGSSSSGSDSEWSHSSGSSKSSGKRRGTSTRSVRTASAKPLPTTDFGAIKRAKVDIQKYLLNTNPAKADALREAAEASIANADEHAGGRREWRKEVLLASNQPFCRLFHPGATNFGWYLPTKTVQWGIDKMPDWARNGKAEPDSGTLIEGKSYIKSPPSQSR
jgi:hypothetical protein